MTSSFAVITLTFALALARFTNEHLVDNEVSSTSFVNNTSNNRNQTYRPAGLCKMNVDNHSIAYFQSRLVVYDLQFAHFSIRFNNSNKYKSTPETFRPNVWVWTYKTSNGLYPFLYWNIDYTLLSFGLLAAKTLKSEMYILFNVPDSCNITFGTPETTQSIANAIRDATSGFFQYGTFKYPKYRESYYCYLAEVPKARDSISYQAAVYFMFPVSYISYNCCVVHFSYKSNNVTAYRMHKQIEKWSQCTLGPYILCIIVLLFYPMLHFRLCVWIASDETVEHAASMPMLHASVQMNPQNDVVKPNEANGAWLYLDGEAPYKFIDILTNIWCGLNRIWPVAISRIRRFCVLIATPVGIYFKLTLYYLTMKDAVELLVKHGTPIGFLSLLGDPRDRVNAFATVFGGPVGILVLYFATGFLLYVVPRSITQMYEDSIPPPTLCFKSPLVLSLIDIKMFSLINKPLEPGYQNVISLLTCGFYMIFTKQFWKWVLNTQIKRIGIIGNPQSSNLVYAFKVFTMPLYIILCIMEILFSIFLYGFPLCMWSVLTLRGTVRSLTKYRINSMQFCRSSILRKVFLDNCLVRVLALLSVTAVVVTFMYVVCLIFIETFDFLSQVMVFCFVAVIVYPSVAFGYLFFSVVIIYYIFRRIRDFGDGYLELLSDAVDISRILECQSNHITFYGDNMVISNVRVPRGIKGLQINNTTIEVAANVFNNSQNKQMLKIAQNKYGIPKDLFHFLVKRHRPVYQQVLKIVFHIMLTIILISLTISISNKYVSGPSSEISMVMHVVFIVVVGALPRALEVTVTGASASAKKEIELRNLEQSVLEYWDEVMARN